MPPPLTYDLFISHSWEGDADYHGLIGLLGNGLSLEWRNLSVPRSAPVIARGLLGIQEALARRIYQADAVLVISGKNLNSSRWVRYELNVARELDKPIIGVEPGGTVASSMEVRRVATTMAAWTADSIEQNIKTLADET